MQRMWSQRGAESMRSPHLVLAVTDPLSALLLRGQPRMLIRAGAEVTLLCAPGVQARELAEQEGARFVPIAMKRSIAPLADLRALSEIRGALRHLAPDLVNAGTPKAGLLVMAAAAAQRVPARVFTLRGLRSTTMEGPSRAVVHAAEVATSRLAHRVVCLSPGLCEEAIGLGIVPRARAIVLGAGSSNGVDVEFFEPSPAALASGRALRQTLGVASDAFVISFVGRVHREKGVLELIAAFEQLAADHRAVLLLAGPDELDRAANEALHQFASSDRVKRLGLVRDVRAVYAASDLVALPSWREGLNNVLLEAAAMGLPVVTTDLTGSRDAVVDKTTGTLVPLHRPDALSQALRAYAVDVSLRRRHGAAARLRAIEAFACHAVWRRQLALYNELLRGLPVRRLDETTVDEGAATRA